MILIGKSVTLRAIERTDNNVFKELINDPETERSVIGWSFPVSSEKQERWLDAMVNENSTGHYRYAIETDGICVGMAVFHEIDFKNSAALTGIKLLKSQRGKGIGVEAMRLLVAYAFDELNLHCLTTVILEDNVASRKMHEKVGFQFEGILRDRIYKNGKYNNLCSYSLLKDEYEKAVRAI